MESAPDLRPINATALGGATCGTAVWRMASMLHVTVIVKATFELVADAAMRLSAPEELVLSEVHHHKSPLRSVRLTQDTAPYMPRADVWLTGHACAPGGAAVEALSVRLAIFRGALLLDKTIHVRGDFKGDETVPFERIPLMYERAYGGIGWEDNPLGVGFGAATGGTRPNLVDPERPERPACFAPLARGWPSRKRLLGGADRRAIERPLAEIPAGFDWTYFQAAPEDQRIDYLKGDEWLILDGVHPTHAHLRSYLPGVRGVARVHGMADGGQGHPLALVADTLCIDADTLRCSVIWRGSFPIPHAAALGAIRIIAGLETEFRQIDWPRPNAPATPPPSAELEDVTDLVRTATVEDAVDTERPRDALVPEGAPTWDKMLALDDEIETVHRPLEPFFEQRSWRTEPPHKPAPGPAAPAVQPSSNETITLTDETLSRPGSNETITLAGETVPRPVLPAALSPLPLPPPPSTQPAQAPVAPLGVPAARESAASTHVKAAPLMGAVSVQGIELINETKLAFGVVPWGLSPARDCLTVIAKATCELIPGGPAELRAEVEPLCRDRFEEGVCVYPSDFALFKVRADVTLTGRAYAPSGAAREAEVSFRFGAAENSFARRILVFGARRWEPGRAAPRPSTPERWEQMPLRPDHAFGGPRFDLNPAGVGYPDPMRRVRDVGVGVGAAAALLPNLEDPDARIRTPHQTPAPAFFSPIPLAWKERWASQGRGRCPWPYLPEELDWTHYQAAPQPQQLAFLRGDEPFTITGAHPQHPILEGALPGLRARCFAVWAEGRGGAFEEVSLYLDTVAFEVERRTLSLVFRGTIGVPDERVPEIDALYLTTEPGDKEGMTLAEARAKLLRR